MSASSGANTEESLDRNGARQLITIIVPTRNEAANIDPLLERIAASLAPLNFEVLFVDDSDDETPAAILGAQDRFSFPVHFIARPIEKRNGLSGAVVDGLQAAGGDWVCVMDADLQHPPETIWQMWEKAQKSGADMVVGSRRGNVVGPYGLTRTRSLTSKLLTVLARMLFPRALRNVSDPLTGLFLVKRSRVQIDLLRPDGFKILLEILVRCPDLHVTEIHFDFAPRSGGRSKADFREGIRFFRHVVRLRATVNPHLARFLATIFIGLAGNSLLLYALAQFAGLTSPWPAVIAAEALALWIVVLFERWAFKDRPQNRRSGNGWGALLRAQLVLISVFIPIFYALVTWMGLNYLAANWLSLLATGFVLYALSEQWVWTGRSMVWQPRSYTYNIHDIVRIESEIQLEDLQHFFVESAAEDIAIQIRLDRQGTPSQLPGGISYDEHLGRFGFGMTVLPGDFFQIIVSPLLGRSPGFLFTNIVEPVLRWSLVAKGYALVKAASVCSESSAILIHSQRDLGEVVSLLCQNYGYRFLADDLTILGEDGSVYSYPKPVTVSQRMLQESTRESAPRRRIAKSLQRLLYTRFARRLGLWLGERNLPAATLNTYLQWLIPQPKTMLGELFAGLEYGESAGCKLIAATLEGSDTGSQEQATKVIRGLQQGDRSASFQPHPLLAERLRYQKDDDLLTRERKIIENTVESVPLQFISIEGKGWWFELAESIYQAEGTNDRAPDAVHETRNAPKLADAYEERPEWP